MVCKEGHFDHKKLFNQVYNFPGLGKWIKLWGLTLFNYFLVYLRRYETFILQHLQDRLSALKTGIAPRKLIAEEIGKCWDLRGTGWRSLFKWLQLLRLSRWLSVVFIPGFNPENWVKRYIPLQFTVLNLWFSINCFWVGSSLAPG
jgi:hypothetical protein